MKQKEDMRGGNVFRVVLEHSYENGKIDGKV